MGSLTYPGSPMQLINSIFLTELHTDTNPMARTEGSVTQWILLLISLGWGEKYPWISYAIFAVSDDGYRK